MPTVSDRKKISKRVSWQSLGDTTYIYKSPNDELYLLQEVGKDIWDCISRGLFMDEIDKELAGKYAIDETVLENDLKEFVESMLKEGWIE